MESCKLNRISDNDLNAVICYILMKNSDSLSTTELRIKFRDFLQRYVELNSSDLDCLQNRNDQKIYQIIRNIVSYRYESVIINEGLVEHKGDVLTVTQKGVKVAEIAIASTL